MLDVKRMRVLREVAAQGSFSGAAEALAFTQSAVSQHVAALERESGTKLVERGSRGIRLTEAGQALVRHADAVIARLDDAEQELAAIAGLRGGRLRLGSFPSAGASLMPGAVALFHERYPDVELTMVEVEPEDSVPLLRQGELDLALVFDWHEDTDPETHGLERVHLLDDPLYAVLPHGHRLAGRRSIRVADLAEEPWINGTMRNACCQMIGTVCRDAGFDPRVVFETDDYQTVQAFVAAGVGVSLIAELGLTAVHPDVVVRPLTRPVPKRRVWLARAEGSYRTPAAEAMTEVLREVASDYAASRRAPVASAA